MRVANALFCGQTIRTQEANVLFAELLTASPFIKSSQTVLRSFLQKKNWTLFSAAAVAASVLAIINWPENKLSNDLTIKGGGIFTLFVERRGVVTELSESCYAGDRVRAHVKTQKPYLMIVNVDAKNNLRVVFPFGSHQAAPIPQDKGLTPDSWVIDSTPGFERFIAIFADQPLTLTEVQPLLITEQQPRAIHKDLVIREISCLKRKDK